MQTTAEVLEGCKRQDRKAQQQLYRDFYCDMKRLLLRYLTNADDMDDVINRAMFKVFRSIDAFQGTSANLGGWARSILIHEVLNFLRSRQKFQQAHTTGDTLPDTPFAPVAEREETEHFLHLLNTLPLTARTVFNLYAIEGYTHAEIAELMNISVANSKWQLHTARKTMQQLITEKQLV